MKVCIYSRISENPDGTSTGTARQERDCRELAASMGWEVARVYREDDTSAFGTKPRPVFEAMVSDIKAGSYDGLLVWKLDRLTRKLKDLATVVDAIETGHAFVRTVEGGINTANGGSHLLLTIQAAIANEESRNTSLRIKRKHQELAENGMHSGGGTRPYGFSADWTAVIEEEAAVIRNIAAALLAGESTLGICKRLTTPTVSGKPWHPTVLRKLMTSARLAGCREYKGIVYQSESIPAILDMETVERLRVLFRNPARKTKNAFRNSLLSGFVKCGNCGSTMHMKALPQGKEGFRWACAKPPVGKGCGRTTVVNAPVELVVIEALLHRLDNPALAEAAEGADTSRQSLGAELVAIRERSASLSQDHYVNGLIDRNTFLAAYEPLKARTDHLESLLACLLYTSDAADE